MLFPNIPYNLKVSLSLSYFFFLIEFGRPVARLYRAIESERFQFDVACELPGWLTVQRKIMATIPTIAFSHKVSIKVDLSFVNK